MGLKTGVCTPLGETSRPLLASGEEDDEEPPMDPPVTYNVSAAREQSDRASRLIGQRMLQGWALLGETCTNDSCIGIPLVRNRQREKFCVICETTYPPENASGETVIHDTSSSVVVAEMPLEESEPRRQEAAPSQQSAPSTSTPLSPSKRPAETDVAVFEVSLNRARSAPCQDKKVANDRSTQPDSKRPRTIPQPRAIVSVPSAAVVPQPSRVTAVIQSGSVAAAHSALERHLGVLTAKLESLTDSLASNAGAFDYAESERITRALDSCIRAVRAAEN